MTICNKVKYKIPGLSHKPIEVNFDGGDITSDAGFLLLERADNHIGLLKKVATLIGDYRKTGQGTFSILNLLRQRIYSIALGYEDLNDHDTLRNDLALQSILATENPLASRTTLWRLEQAANRKTAFNIHQMLVEHFINSFTEQPKELILDFDATDDLVHGKQEGAFFHGFYGNYCFLPLYVFCNNKLLVSYLRPSNQDGAKHTWAILSLLVKRLRKAWPSVRIIFRGDSGFCRHQMFNWCECHNVYYITGLAQNARLRNMAKSWIDQAEANYNQSQINQRIFGELTYAAKTWKRKRRVIAKTDHSNKGSNPRFIVTNLSGDPKALYEKLYCARADMENRIKEQQLDLFADRTSCKKWWSNQFRLLLASLAYVLIETIRCAAAKTQFEHAQTRTIRIKLLKIGAIILRNTRRIRFCLSSAYPYQAAFLIVLKRLVPI
jgi:hypothetical protein